MAYKHRDIVIAWMDGADVEMQLDDGRWYGIASCTNRVQHSFIEDRGYRIKPKPVMIRHAVIDGCSTVLVYTKNYNKQEDLVSSQVEEAGAILWLDEWHEAAFSAPDV